MNTSTLANSTVLINNNLASIFNSMDVFTRCLLVTTHIFYFMMVCLFRELQKISNLNMHHSNLIGLLSGIHYCLWINRTTINSSDAVLNNILCNLAEFLWPVIRHARAYSILVLAAYRYIAVFYTHLFSKIACSLKYNLISAVLVWLMAILIFIITKYPLGTTASANLCLDGGTSNLTIFIIYYLITAIFGFILPSGLVLLAYSLVHHKLTNLFKCLDTKDKPTEKNMSNRKKLKEQKLAFQLIMVNFFDILSIIFMLILTFTRLIPILDKNYPFLRQLWRSLNNLCQSFIPIVSLICHPSRLSLSNVIFLKRKIDTTRSTNTISNR